MSDKDWFESMPSPFDKPAATVHGTGSGEATRTCRHKTQSCCSVCGCCFACCVCRRVSQYLQLKMKDVLSFGPAEGGTDLMISRNSVLNLLKELTK